MERTPATAAGGSSVPPAPTPPPAELPPDRVVEVEVGQLVRATVVAQEGDQAWFGWRGAIFAASTRVPLQPGSDYDFVVTSTSPRIELAAAAAPSESVFAVQIDALGGAAIERLLAAVRQLPPDDPTVARMRGALAVWQRGEPVAADLAAFQRLLGHDLEARVARLAVAQSAGGDGAAVAAARRTLKAKVIAALAGDSGTPARSGAAALAALVAGLSQIERDNAARQDLSLPLWVPLPTCPAAGLLDARMFVRGDDASAADAAAPAGERPFTIVLLLDLTRLGELRVDVELRGERVEAVFLSSRGDVVESLQTGFAELQAALAKGGLVVDRLTARTVPHGVPRADLVLPPRDGSAMVDVHA